MRQIKNLSPCQVAVNERPTYVLITGASSGIGLELAKVFAKKGHHLILTSRRLSLLEELAGQLKSQFDIQVLCFQCDFTKTQQIEELWQTLHQQNIVVETLVNNAGVGVFGTFDQTLWEDELELIQLNVIAPTLMTKRFIKQLKQQNLSKGQLLNIASAAGLTAGPLMAVYYASKAYLISWSLACLWEFRNDLTVSIVCPGPVKTQFQRTAKMQDSYLFDQKLTCSATFIAESAYHALQNKKMIIIPGKALKLLVLPRNFLPLKFRLWIVEKLQSKRQ